MSFSIITAIDSNYGIGYNNTLPWNIKEDMQYFKKITSSNKSIVIMGKNTWLSIPENYKPLVNRINMIITSSESIPNLDNLENTLVFKNLENCLSIIKDIYNDYNVWVIGGEQLYREAISRNECKYIYLTHLCKTKNTYKCDKFFPNIDTNFQIVSCKKLKYEDNKTLEFLIYENLSTINNSEQNYLDKLKLIINSGIKRDDRTKIGTRSIFGTQFRYDLTNNQIPLLTTKNMYWKGIVEELLWFLNGKTDSKLLENKNVNIWKGNSSKEFLEKRGLEYNEGDIGPGYGFSFRHWGGDYKGCHYNYGNDCGVDQVNKVLYMLKNDKYSRRIIIDLWNVKELDNMALPPCHILYQFYVHDNKLSCSMYQRSGDMGLGVPFNIASASLLTILFAKLSNLEPYELIHTIGDTHIYENHIEPLREQILRKPRPYPTISFKNKNYNKIEDFTNDDIELNGYISYPNIKMDMAV